MINEEELKRKILNFEELTDKEVEAICICDYNCLDYVCEQEGKMHRWYIDVSTIVKIENRFFSVSYSRGLTECQDNMYCEQVATEVEKVEVKTHKWVPLEKEAK